MKKILLLSISILLFASSCTVFTRTSLSHATIGDKCYLRVKIFQAFNSHEALAKGNENNSIVVKLITTEDTFYDGKVLSGEYIMVDTYTYTYKPDTKKRNRRICKDRPCFHKIFREKYSKTTTRKTPRRSDVIINISLLIYTSPNNSKWQTLSKSFIDENWRFCHFSSIILYFCRENNCTMIQRKTYLAQLEAVCNQDLIKVVTGIRRCGKSTLMIEFQELLKSKGVDEKCILSLNFEERENSQFEDWRIVYDLIIT